MATTTIFLRLTDGTTTCDFSTGSTTFSIRAPGWEPAIAAPRESALGGLGAYSDVDEVIPLYVLGSTAALAQAQLRALVRLLDQAKAFDDGENSTPVRLEAQVQGSDLAAPLQVAYPWRARHAGRHRVCRGNAVCRGRHSDRSDGHAAGRVAGGDRGNVFERYELYQYRHRRPDVCHQPDRARFIRRGLRSVA